MVALLLIVFVLFLYVFCFPVYADFDGEVLDDSFPLNGDDPTSNYESEEDILDSMYWLIDERLPLGLSDSLGSISQSVMPVVDSVPEPPPLHDDFSSGMSAFGIGQQPTYPYTGGAFAHVNSNYGVGIIMIPESFKTGYLGFRKGTDNIMNLHVTSISGYWISGGQTYTLQIPSLGVPRYYYYNGVNWVWRDITTTVLNDSNIQFLDETGERGIQRPVFTISDRLLIIFIVIELFIHGLSLVRRR